MNTLVVLSHHGAAASSSRPGLRAQKAVGTRLYVLDRDRMYHSNVKHKSVNVFIDSNNMPPYSAKTKKQKCTLLALTAPEVYHNIAMGTTSNL